MDYQTGKLIDYSRINGSSNGNPNYSLTIETTEGDYIYTRSSSDSSFCYGIHDSWTGRKIKYTATKSGRINYMKLEV